ncbi:hypothetical protein BLA14095_02056 [Burkholderia lata]|nr:hypothetical protein BLA14095_02056 [Burkholderia lata]
MNPVTLVLSAAFVLAAFAVGAWGVDVRTELTH